MRTNPARLASLVETLASLRLPGSAGQREAITRLASSLREAGLKVVPRARTLSTHSIAEIPSALEVWPAALVALVIGMVLEWNQLAGWGSPSPYTLAGLFAMVGATAVLSRRLHSGHWGPSRVHVTDLEVHRSPGADEALLTVWIVTRSDTPPPASVERLSRLVGSLGWLWLGLLCVPGVYFGMREWLSRSSPALMVGLAGLAILRRVDPWVQRPEPYTRDNRTGLALAVELAWVLPPLLRERAEVRWLILGGPVEPAELHDARSGHLRPDRSPLPGSSAEWHRHNLVLWLDAPGVGSQLELAGAGPALGLGLKVGKDLWLPMKARTRFDGRGLASIVPDQRSFVALCGSTDAGAVVNSAVLEGAIPWVGQLALRYSRISDGGVARTGAVQGPSVE